MLQSLDCRFEMSTSDDHFACISTDACQCLSAILLHGPEWQRPVSGAVPVHPAPGGGFAKVVRGPNTASASSVSVIGKYKKF